MAGAFPNKWNFPRLLTTESGSALRKKRGLTPSRCARYLNGAILARGLSRLLGEAVQQTCRELQVTGFTMVDLHVQRNLNQVHRMHLVLLRRRVGIEDFVHHEQV